MGVTNPPAGRDVGEGMADTQSLVGRLASGEVILGDGSYIMTLEKRGYATAGSWTPEAAAEHPEAIEQLGIEFARAGADTSQPLADLSQQLSAASPTQQLSIEEFSADLGRSFCQLRNQDCFYEHLLSFVRRSLPA